MRKHCGSCVYNRLRDKEKWDVFNCNSTDCKYTHQSLIEYYGTPYLNNFNLAIYSLLFAITREIIKIKELLQKLIDKKGEI